VALLRHSKIAEGLSVSVEKRSCSGPSRGGTTVKRRDFFTLLGGTAAAWPLAARAQQLRLAQIGVLVLTNADGQSLTRELRLGLRDLGYSEGQNFVFQLRSSDGDPAIGIMDPCCLPSGRNCLFQAGKTTSRMRQRAGCSPRSGRAAPSIRTFSPSIRSTSSSSRATARRAWSSPSPA
jgi:hypothetical protein